MVEGRMLATFALMIIACGAAVWPFVVRLSTPSTQAPFVASTCNCSNSTATVNETVNETAETPEGGEAFVAQNSTQATCNCSNGTATVNEIAASADVPLLVTTVTGGMLVTVALAAAFLLKLPFTLKAEMFFSSADVASDLMWLMLEEFLDEVALLNSVAIRGGASLAFVVWFIATCGGDRERLPLAQLLDLVWQAPIVRLKTHSIRQVFDEPNSLEKCLANTVAWSAVVLAVPTTLCITLALDIVHRVLLVLVGTVLHTTRLLAVERVRRMYLAAWGIGPEVGAADFVFDAMTWHLMVLAEITLEAAPSITANVANMFLTKQVGAVSVMSLCFSSYVLLRMGYKYTYNLGVHDRWPNVDLAGSGYVACCSRSGGGGGGVEPTTVGRH